MASRTTYMCDLCGKRLGYDRKPGVTLEARFEMEGPLPKPTKARPNTWRPCIAKVGRDGPERLLLCESCADPIATALLVVSAAISEAKARSNQ